MPSLFPGSIPLRPAVRVLLIDRGGRRVIYRPIHDERFAFVETRADFRTAIEQGPRHRPSLGEVSDKALRVGCP